jgi:hypothetical protein
VDVRYRGKVIRRCSILVDTTSFCLCDKGFDISDVSLRHGRLTWWRSFKMSFVGCVQYPLFGEDPFARGCLYVSITSSSKRGVSLTMRTMVGCFIVSAVSCDGESSIFWFLQSSHQPSLSKTGGTAGLYSPPLLSHLYSNPPSLRPENTSRKPAQNGFSHLEDGAQHGQARRPRRPQREAQALLLTPIPCPHPRSPGPRL